MGTNNQQAVINDLIGQIKEAAASEQNLRRGKRQPVITVGIEVPIAWHILFGYDINRYFSDPLFYFEQTLRQMLWRYENIPDDTPLTLDMPAWLGHYPEYTFIGLGVSFSERGVPLLQEDHPLTCEPDLCHLKLVEFKSSGWMPRILRWYNDLNTISAGRMNVTFNITWWRGCLDLAIQLRGYCNFVLDTLERPEFIHDLLKFLVEQRCLWYEAYYRYFGQKVAPTSVADDWINIPFITPDIFADFVLPRYLEIEKYHGGITGIHSCGNQTPVQQYLLQIKSLQTFEVSPWTDLTQTLINIPADKNLTVSVHPNDILVAGPEEMRTKLQFIGDSCRRRNYTLGTSGLTPITGNHQEFIDRINTWLDIARTVL